MSLAATNIRLGQARSSRGGLYSYLATPYDRNGDVNVGVLREYTEQMLASGISGVTCVASTCEGPYLTDAERMLVVETVGRAVDSRLHMNVGIGAFSTRQAIAYAKHAQAFGATSLMLEMPQYFPVSTDEVVRHYEAVAGAVDLPIRLYNLTLPTRFDFTPELVCRMSSIGAIDSVKEASGDVRRLQEIRLLAGDRFDLYCGFHYQALEGFRLGADGWEVMMHPVIAHHLVRLYELLKADPWSCDGALLFTRLQPMFQLFKQFGVPQCIKAISEVTDLKFGVPRAPYPQLNEFARARVQQELVAVNGG